MTEEELGGSQLPRPVEDDEVVVRGNPSKKVIANRSSLLIRIFRTPIPIDRVQAFSSRR